MEMRNEGENISGDYYEKVYDIYLTYHLPVREQSPEADVLSLLQTPSSYRFSCKTNQQQIRSQRSTVDPQI
jgi:hypothetical protein